MTVGFWELVEWYRLQRGFNMWADGLEMDLIYLICGWN